MRLTDNSGSRSVYEGRVYLNLTSEDDRQVVGHLNYGRQTLAYSLSSYLVARRNKVSSPVGEMMVEREP